MKTFGEWIEQKEQEPLNEALIDRLKSLIDRGKAKLAPIISRLTKGMSADQVVDLISSEDQKLLADLSTAAEAIRRLEVSNPRALKALTRLVRGDMTGAQANPALAEQAEFEEIEEGIAADPEAAAEMASLFSGMGTVGNMIAMIIGGAAIIYAALKVGVPVGRFAYEFVQSKGDARRSKTDAEETQAAAQKTINKMKKGKPSLDDLTPEEAISMIRSGKVTYSQLPPKLKSKLAAMRKR